jgi:hypothetical protein
LGYIFNEATRRLGVYFFLYYDYGKIT